MIGNTLLSPSGNKYTIQSLVAGPNRPNANVYLCENENQEKFIAKHFYKMHPMANIGLNVHNHYGRRRDGSWQVFKEIQEKNTLFPFLIKHIDRINYEGKWVIIQEYVEGITLSQYIYDNYENRLERVIEAVRIFSKVLSEWHNNEFAHGDPHLGNVIVAEDILSNKLTVKLIDYCQIHHPTFKYCEEYDCFSTEHTKRIRQDLFEDSGKLGKGFKYEIMEIDDELELNNNLVDEFNKFYTFQSP